jgi:hypothetical protein
MFWLTMYSNISMKFSVITCRISPWRMFLCASLGSLASFIFVLLESGTRYPFSLFLSESCFKLFYVGEWFPSLFFLPIIPLGTLQLCFGRLVGGFSHLFSFPWFNFVL